MKVHPPVAQRRQRLREILSSRLIRAVLITLALLLPLWWQAGQWCRDRLLLEQRVRTSAALLPYANALSSTVHQRLALLEGLAAFAHIEHTDTELRAHFGPFAAELHESTSGVRALNVGANGVVQYIYPLVGNEGAVGHDVLHDPRPEVKAAVERAIQTRRITLNGPFELRQGGMGIIGRHAVYEGDRLWGLATIVLDVPPILHEAGVDRPHDSVDLALCDDAGKVFHGSAAVLGATPVVYRIDLVDGAWTIAGIPTGGWNAAIAGNLAFFRGVGIVLIGLLTSVVALVMNREATLVHLVRQRTLALEAEVLGHQQAEEALRTNEEQLTVVLAASQKAEVELTEQLETIRQQQEAIRTLSTPILHVWDDVIALPVLGTLDTARATAMMEALLEAVARMQARYVILDLTGVEVIDASTADQVVRLVSAVELLGARGIVTGIRPHVARALCGVQANLTRLITLANLRSALLYCMRQKRA